MGQRHAREALKLADRFLGWTQPARLLDSIWARLLGPEGPPLDFGRLERSRSRNDALACPPDACATATTDRPSPRFPVSADRLRDIVFKVALAEPRTERIDPASSVAQASFVVRSPILRFPDRVDVRVIPCGEHGSTLAIYSRSRVGRRDFGVNRRRIERWLRHVAAMAR